MADHSFASCCVKFTWLWVKGVRWFIQVNRVSIPCSIEIAHPFVPTCLPAERRASGSQDPSRMLRTGGARARVLTESEHVARP